MTTPLTSRLLHLVRHGETVGESSIRYHGRTDVALSALGRAQIEALAGAIAPLRVEAIVHSPQVRAVESARILAQRLGLTSVPMQVEADFAEIDFGVFEGLTRAEIEARDPDWFVTWQRGKHTGFPGGEQLEQFAARVRAGFARMLARVGGDALVVAHRGVIRHIVEAVVPERAHVPTDLASVSTLDLARRLVVRWNVCAPEA